MKRQILVSYAITHPQPPSTPTSTHHHASHYTRTCVLEAGINGSDKLLHPTVLWAVIIGPCS